MSALPPLLRAFLDDTRVPSNRQPAPAEVRQLADFAETINSQLIPDARSPLCRMHVLRTCNCVTETAWFPTGPWILFDTGLKDATTDLNTLALTQSTPQDTFRWAYQTLARFLALEGDWQLACAALLAGDGSSLSNADPESISANAAGACTLIQDYFTLAHEFVHLAIAEGRLTKAAAAHDAEVTAAFMSSEPTAQTHAATKSLITFDVAAALGRSNGLDTMSVALPDSFAGEVDSVLRDLGTHDLKTERPAQLKEELLCDALATNLTVGAFRDTFDEPSLLLAIYMGFKNLQCIEIVRDLAETLAAANRGRSPDESEAHTDAASSKHAGAVGNGLWRLSAWRSWLPTSILRTPSTEMWNMLRRASREYHRSVGDEILLALPSRFNDWLTELQKLGPLPLTRDLVTLMVLGDCNVETLVKIIELSGFDEDRGAQQLVGALHERDQPHLHAVQMEAIRRTLGIGETSPDDEPAPSSTYASTRATVEDLARMFDDGVFEGATHMIVVCDTFDYTDFPEYVMPAQDVHLVEAEAAKKPFQRVMEVYNLREDKLEQMRSERVFRY